MISPVVGITAALMSAAMWFGLGWYLMRNPARPRRLLVVVLTFTPLLGIAVLVLSLLPSLVRVFGA